jgi:hypothetical protein
MRIPARIPMSNASGRRAPESRGRGREALEVVVATGETPASGETGSRDEPIPVPEGVGAETGREDEVT